MEMKRLGTLMIVSLAVIAAVAAVGLSQLTRGTSAERTRDVVLIECRSMGLPSRIIVAHSGSSDNAPSVPSGETAECAQALADVLGAGFGIEDVQSDSHVSIHYTLIRQ
jgi:hypothetical protein